MKVSYQKNRSSGSALGGDKKIQRNKITDQRKRARNHWVTAGLKEGGGKNRMGSGGKGLKEGRHNYPLHWRDTSSGLTPGTDGPKKKKKGSRKGGIWEGKEKIDEAMVLDLVKVPLPDSPNRRK